VRRYSIGDAWTEACLLKAEEALEEARARSARRARLREDRPPRRPVRVWLAGRKVRGLTPHFDDYPRGN